jgi:hypothetical protein
MIQAGLFLLPYWLLAVAESQGDGMTQETRISSGAVSRARGVERCVSGYWLYLTSYARCPEDGGE